MTDPASDHYRIVGFKGNGDVTLRNILTGEEITRVIVVDIRDWHLRVADPRGRA